MSNTDDNIFFIIENKKLYLGGIFIGTEFEPDLCFLLDENKNFYISLLVINDKEEFFYVLKTTESELIDIVNGKITMRSAFLSKPYFFEAIFHEDKNIISKRDIIMIDKDVLPYEGAYYNQQERIKKNLIRMIKSKKFFI